jgi:hypothetical protein
MEMPRVDRMLAAVTTLAGAALLALLGMIAVAAAVSPSAPAGTQPAGATTAATVHLYHRHQPKPSPGARNPHGDPWNRSHHARPYQTRK